MGKQITIHNPNNLPLVDYRTVNILQGNLKDLDQQGYRQLRSRLLKRGFKHPLNLWKKDDGTVWMMDGTQRHRVMSREDMNDHGSYEVPYLIVEATDELDAREQLLEITSQYGKMTYEGFDEYVGEMRKFDDFNYTDLVSQVRFDALPLLSDQLEPPKKEKDKSDTPGDDSGGFVKLTFTLRSDQAQIVKDALENARNYIDGDGGMDKPTDSDSLYHISQSFLDNE